jgi:hypothetical protein
MSYFESMWFAIVHFYLLPLVVGVMTIILFIPLLVPKLETSDEVAWFWVRVLLIMITVYVGVVFIHNANIRV